MPGSRNFSPFGNTAITFPCLNACLCTGWLCGHHPLAEIMPGSRNFSPFGNTAITFPCLNACLCTGWLCGHHPLAEAVGVLGTVFIKFHTDQAAVYRLTL